MKKIMKVKKLFLFVAISFFGTLFFCLPEASAEGKLVNLSTRGYVGVGDDVMIGGFIVSGGSVTVLIRSQGPSLSGFGVSGVLNDPTLELFSGQNSIGFNDDWQQQNSQDVQDIISTGKAPLDPREPALLVTLNTGGYTAIVRGFGGTTGVAIVEAIKADLPQVQWGVYNNKICCTVGSYTLSVTIGGTTRSSTISSCTSTASWAGWVSTSAGTKSGTARESGSCGTSNFSFTQNFSANMCYVYYLDIIGSQTVLARQVSSSCPSPPIIFSAGSTEEDEIVIYSLDNDLLSEDLDLLDYKH